MDKHPPTRPITSFSCALHTAVGASAFIDLDISGDSYSSTNFNSSEEAPSRRNRFGNPPYPGVTTADGINWIDNVVYNFNLSRLNDTLTLCWNYAFPGALVTRLPNDKPVPDYYAFEDQTELFKANAGSIRWKSSNSIFISWFGINDSGLNVASGLGPQRPKQAFSGIAKTYFEQLDEFYQYGGRAFMVMKVPRKCPKHQ